MFSEFPATIYEDKLVTDILKKVQFTDGFRRSSFVENYRVQEEDTPESLAYLLYGDTLFAWIILSLNQMSDRNNDWPYSYINLERIVQNKYKGSSVFIPESNIDFSFANVVSISKNRSYTVSSWDRSLNKLTTSTPITEIQQNDTVTLTFKDSTTKTVQLGRVVYEETFAIHHFEDTEGNYLDPRDSDNADQEYESLCDSCLTGYINGSSELYVITNRDYELSINDKKRDILLMRPEYAPRLLGKIKNLFQQVSKDSNVFDVQNSLTVGDLSE